MICELDGTHLEVERYGDIVIWCRKLGNIVQRWAFDGVPSWAALREFEEAGFGLLRPLL